MSIKVKVTTTEADQDNKAIAIRNVIAATLTGNGASVGFHNLAGLLDNYSYHLTGTHVVVDLDEAVKPSMEYRRSSLKDKFVISFNIFGQQHWFGDKGIVESLGAALSFESLLIANKQIEHYEAYLRDYAESNEASYETYACQPVIVEVIQSPGYTSVIHVSTQTVNFPPPYASDWYRQRKLSSVNQPTPSQE